MRLLITGAAGHIGSRWIHSFKPGDYEEVLLLDNFASQRYCSLFDLPSGVAFRLVEGEVQQADLGKYFSGVDVVVHLAAITDAASSFDAPDQVEEVNAAGTERVARACLAHGCRLLFLSTTSVYGKQEGVVDEDCPATELQPQSPYAESKLKAERLLQQLGQDEGLQFVICRFGTIFGVSPGMRFHTAINKFVWQACTGRPLTVWRTALDQKRPYLDLKDAVRVLDHIVRTGIFNREIYNILTVNATVGEIVEIIRSFVPDTQVRYVDSPIMNQLSYTVSREKFEKLGLEFLGDLRQGIAETVRLLANVRAGAVATPPF